MARVPLLLLSLLLLSVAANATSDASLKSGTFDPPRLAPDFTLTGSHGKELTLSEYRGKLVILGFGFTHCTDICPVTLAKLAQVYHNLGTLAGQVQVVYVTVDPERDSVERLREYMSHFNSSFIGVTGAPEQLSTVRQSYGILAAKEVHKDGSYEVHHSSYIYLIDRQGLLRALVPFGTSVDSMVHDIAILLQDNPK